MPSNEQPRELKPYSNKKNWVSGEKIGSTELNNIENQIDDLTEVVRAIDDKLVVFGPATSSTNGTKGVVPAPQAGDENKYLKGDGTWTNDIVANSFTGSGAGLTNIPSGVTGLASSAISGAMSSEQYIKLDELPTNTQLQTNYVSKSSVSDASGIPNADTTQYGLVKIGSNINVDDGTISVPLATSNAPGIVNIGNGININNGEISIPLATSSVSGIVSVGNGLSVDNGIISNNLNIKNSTGTGSIIEGLISGSITNEASGNYSHAEGVGTVASNTCAHTEGNGTVASGECAHAEGTSTNAKGAYSHTEGYVTVANHKSQHVFGEYNISDDSSTLSTERGTYIEIVGNGQSGAKSNARTLDWSGNEWLAGSITAAEFYMEDASESILYPMGWHILWTNDNSSERFSSQNITPNSLEQYEQLYIVCKHDTGSSLQNGENNENGILIPNLQGHKTNLYTVLHSYGNWNTRVVTVLDGRLNFGSGTQHIATRDQTSSTTNDFVCVPYMIYGVN